MTETRGVIRLVHLSEHFLFVQASGYDYFDYCGGFQV
jgi:hypothetical protein